MKESEELVGESYTILYALTCQKTSIDSPGLIAPRASSFIF